MSEVQPAVYAAGRLFFRQGSTLVARAFDAGRLEFSGGVVPLADRGSMFSVSTGGVIVYLSEAVRPTQLTWFNRDGTRRGTLGDPGYIERRRAGPKRPARGGVS